MKILMTGFEPFGGQQVNPSWLAVKQLAEKRNDITAVELPVSYHHVKAALLAAIESDQYDAIISVGQAGREDVIRLEQIAINLAYSPYPDNDGVTVDFERLDKQGDAAYFSRLPIKKLLKQYAELNIPASLSLSAGSYICNQVMYYELQYCQQHGLDIPCGFIHVPFMTGQVEGRKGQPLETMVEALDILADVITNQPILEVVAAYLEKDGKFLVAKRGAEKARSGRWEFVGGKVEPGETKGEALQRELMEELDIRVETFDEIADTIWHYPDLTVHLHLLRAQLEAGKPTLTEHEALRFISLEEAGLLDFCEADQRLLKQLREKRL